MQALGGGADITERVIGATLLVGVLLAVAGIVFATIENRARDRLRDKGEAFAKLAFGSIHDLAEKMLSDERPRATTARERVVAELREVRLATGEILDGWARAVHHAGLAPRLLVAAVVCIALGVILTIALLFSGDAELAATTRASSIATLAP